MQINRRQFAKGAAGLILPAASQAGLVAVDPDSSDPLNLPLYDTSNITYQGYFLVPEGSDGSVFSGNQYGIQGGNAIAYDPTGDGGNGSLFISAGLKNNTGSDPSEPCVCEISIETPKTSAHDRASLLQSYVYLAGSENNFDYQGNHSGSNGTSPTGMVCIGDELFFTAAGVYRDIAQPTCLFKRSTDLSNTAVSGPYSVVSGADNQRDYGNGIGCVIPEVWRSTFGGATIMGGGGHDLSLLNNLNYGPGFWAMNHADVSGAAESNIAATSILKHPNGSSSDGGSGYYPYDDGQMPNALFSGMSSHRGTIMLPDSRTVLAYGKWAAGVVYDTGGAISGLTQGPIALDGSLIDRFLLFDAQDLKDAFDGVVTDVEGTLPYAKFDMDFSNTNGSYRPGSRVACWDVDNRRCFILEANGAGNSYPCVHVLSL